MPSKGGLIYHLTCLLYALYLWKLKNHELSLKLQISVMVSIAYVSKMGMIELILVIPV